MLKKSSNTTNLQFFSDTTILNLKNEVQKVITDLQLGHLEPDQATKSLQDAERDIHRIFWIVTSKINHYRTFIDSYQHYTLVTGHNPCSHLNQSHNPAAQALVNGFEDYKNGPIDFSAWERIAISCENALKSETKAIRNEVRDFLRQARKQPIIANLDINQAIDYNCGEDDLADFKVQVNNSHFGFTKDNPIDGPDAGDVADDIYKGREL